MARRMQKRAKITKQALNMSEHATRLRALPGSPWEAMRGILAWIAGGIILMALFWLALGR